MSGLFKTVTGGDGSEIGVGTAVVTEAGGGDWAVVEELRWTSRGEMARVRWPDGSLSEWLAASHLHSAENQRWRPEGWSW